MEYRVKHLNATVCYLKKDDKVLMLKYAKKWGQIYTPPGGKFNPGESPLDCILREFKEETGLTLINPKLQGISYWHDAYEGIIFVFVATDYKGNLSSSNEGSIEWIDAAELEKINGWEQNKKFIPYLFKDKLFEGKFLLNDKSQVIDYNIREM